MSTIGYAESERRRAERMVVVSCPHCGRRIRFGLDHYSGAGHRLDPEAPHGIRCPYVCPKCGEAAMGAKVLARCGTCGYDAVTQRDPEDT